MQRFGLHRDVRGLFIADGYVHCSRLGVALDVDRCFACTSFRGMEQDAHGDDIVVCEPRASIAQPELY